MRAVASLLVVLVVVENHAAYAGYSRLVAIGDALPIPLLGSEPLQYFGEALVLNNARQVGFSGITRTGRDGAWIVDYLGSVQFVAAEGGVSVAGVDEEETGILLNDRGNVLLVDAFVNGTETTAFRQSDGSIWLPTQDGEVPPDHDGRFLNDRNQYLIEVDSDPMNRSFFVAGPTSGVRLLINESDPSPDTTGGLNLDSIRVLGHADSGDIILSAQHKDDAGLYAYRSGESLADTIIPAGVAPQVAEQVGLGTFDAAVFSASGNGLALGRLQRRRGVTSDTEDVLYRISSDGDISLIARKGDRFDDGLASVGYFGEMSINVNGRATIDIGINDGTGAHFNSLWISEPDGSLIELLPALSIEDADHFDSTMNDFGQVLVTAYLNSGGVRLYGLDANNDFHVVAEAGQSIELDGQMRTISNLLDDQVAINNLGEIAFWAELDGQAWTLVVSDQLAGEFLNSGDANLDGVFNSADLVAVFAMGQYEDLIPLNSTWVSGDWNGDGEFDTSDLVLAFQEGRYEQGPPDAVMVVPESASSVMLMTGLIGIAIRRRQVGR